MLVFGWCLTVPAITIVPDYTYDTNDFFDTPLKKDALQAAADRFSTIITSSLLAVSPSDSEPGWRIGVSHPGTGESINISTATSAGSDPLVNPGGAPPADVYGFGGLATDTWILYSGGRPLGTAGIGGTRTGINFTTVLDDLEGPMHRGLIPNTPSNTVSDLPVWGGSIAFDSGTSWHFDTSTEPPLSSTDFYSIALHEIGHALGLSTDWNQWADDVSGSSFTGSHAVAAFNADNSTNVASLSMESSSNMHWQDETYDSIIFSAANPNYVGTVGAGNLQDLLMEPVSNFTQTLRRFELTNVDVAALEDVGWSVVSTIDLNGDGMVSGADVDLACSQGLDLSPWFDALDSLLADADFDGQVQFSDFVILSENFANSGFYTDGDFDCDGQVQFSDFVILSERFGQSAADSALSSVPEPAGLGTVGCLCGLVLLRRLRRGCERVGRMGQSVVVPR